MQMLNRFSSISKNTCLLTTVLAAALIIGCTVPPVPQDTEHGERTMSMREVPPPDGSWRPHVLQACSSLEQRQPATAERHDLEVAWDLFQAGEGADAIAELELSIGERPRAGGLVLLTLAQLYVMAGQGVPELVPREGPAADTGNWERNKARFLSRAEDLIERCRPSRPDDAVLDYLLGDCRRARGDLAGGAAAVEDAQQGCTLTASFDILRKHQDLVRTPPRQLTPAQPVWPTGVTKGGEVELDLLIAPDGRVHQIETVKRPGRLLGEAAVAAFKDVRFEAARIGKYQIWAWQRTSVVFR